MAQRIRIRLRSYDNVILDRSSKEIVELAKRTGAIVSGPIPIPTRRRIYTVLRSPFIDKKSREQFEMRVHKRLIDLGVDERALRLIMRVPIPEGVSVEIVMLD